MEEEQKKKRKLTRCQKVLSQGEKTSSSALHMGFGRHVPADNIERMFKTHESRGKDIFPDLSPIP